MDVYLQFQLYYAEDIPKMHLWCKEKEKATKTAKLRAKAKAAGTDGDSGDNLVEDDSEESSKNRTEDDGDDYDGKNKSDKKDKEVDGDDEGKENDEANAENVVDGDEDEQPIRKIPRRRDFFTICKDNGLGSLVKKFGLTPEQFAENLRDNYQRHEPGQVVEEPEELAEQFICKYVFLLFKLQ